MIISTLWLFLDRIGFVFKTLAWPYHVLLFQQNLFINLCVLSNQRVLKTILFHFSEPTLIMHRYFHNPFSPIFAFSSREVCKVDSHLQNAQELRLEMKSTFAFFTIHMCKIPDYIHWILWIIFTFQDRLKSTIFNNKYLCIKSSNSIKTNIFSSYL